MGEGVVKGEGVGLICSAYLLSLRSVRYWRTHYGVTFPSVFECLFVYTYLSICFLHIYICVYICLAPVANKLTNRIQKAP